MLRKKDTGEYRQLLDGVHMKTLVYGEKTLMSKFKLAKEARVPFHLHPHEQTGIIISGKLRFKIGDEMFEAIKKQMKELQQRLDKLEKWQDKMFDSDQPDEPESQQQKDLRPRDKENEQVT